MDLSELENWPLKDIIYRLPDYFDPEGAEGERISVQFRLNGRESGRWCMHIADSRCWIEDDVCMNPDISLTADSEDVRRMLRGEINPLQILLRGLVQIEGDRSVALRLGGLFRSPA